MVVIAEDWIKSKYITVDSYGWHCSDDAPNSIKKKFKEFMALINSEQTVMPTSEALENE